MNIVTYATPVSIRPERVWALGLYKETVSEENMSRSKECILQLLTEDHTSVIGLLGGTSGRDVDKEAECSKLGLEWQELNEDGTKDSTVYPKVLPGCRTYLHLTLQGDFIDAGCHLIAPYCKVERIWTSFSEEDEDDEPLTEEESTLHLTTGRLRDLGLITKQGRAVLPEAED